MSFKTKEFLPEMFRGKSSFLKAASRKALIIEDDYVFYMLIIEALEGIGISCKRVFSIETAIKLMYLNKKFDLIVINNSMSTSANGEMMRYLKKDFSIPVLEIGEPLLAAQKEKKSQNNNELDWIDCSVTTVTEVEILQEAIISLV